MRTYPHFITNFGAEELPIYTICINALNEKVGKKLLYIEDNATAHDGRKLPNDRTLYITEHRDLSDFWSLMSYIKGCIKSFNNI